MPRHRRGWGLTYGPGEPLPDLDPTPPEPDEEPDPYNYAIDQVGGDYRHGGDDDEAGP